MTVFRKSDELITREIAEETILVPVKGTLASLQQIHVLSPVAAFIWERLDGVHDLAAIQRAILERFDVSAKQARADLDELVAELERAKLIVAVEDRADAEDERP